MPAVLEIPAAGHPYDVHKDGILRQFETRIANATEDEFTTACAQVERIARLRLEDLL